MIKHYVLFVWGDVEPRLYGPYKSDSHRDRKARELRDEHGESHGIFRLDQSQDDTLTVDSYSGAFFEPDEGDDQ